MEEVYIGTSGWSYGHWRGIFYPEDMKSRDYFSFYARHFRTVEINSTFYHMPRKTTIIKWRDSAPSGFRFTFKVNRQITHYRKLQDVDELLSQFIDTVKEAEKTLGALLYQLPPSLKYAPDLLRDFLTLLPKEGFEHVIEFRHNSWVRDDVFSLLEEFGVIYCIVSAPRLECVLKATAPAVYVRFHGADAWYRYDYSDEELAWWADKIAEFRKKGL